VRRWPLARPFRIARGVKTYADVIEVHIDQDGKRGRGEGVPYKRFGESMDSVIASVEAQVDAIGNGLTRLELGERLAAGAARNAIDCALWDLEAKLSGRRVWQLAGLPEPRPQITAFTLSIDSPEAMAELAHTHRQRPLLKLKLAGDGVDLARLAAVHEAAPKAALWLDANEGLTIEGCRELVPHLPGLGVVVLEQPVPAADDAGLTSIDCPVPLCADESFHGGVERLDALAEGYTLINVKLDKAGGLTEALRVMRAAQERDLGVAVGCMCSSSLSIAPASLLAQHARYTDLDAALLLAEDHPTAVRYDGPYVLPTDPALWG
jgi:L-alanine-DL-glutamate epimerase-like enolase superfamily enzyme